MSPSRRFPLLLAGAFAFGALCWQSSPAEACDPAEATGAIVTPQNGDTVLPDTEFMVLGDGLEPSEDDEATLTDEAGTPYELEFDTVERPGTFNWIALYRPTEELSSGQYDFAMPFESDNGGSRVTFQVRDGDEADIRQAHISQWQVAVFEETIEDQCIGGFASKVRIPFGAGAGGDAPVWYDVELTSEDGEETTRRAVVPGAVEADQEGVVREVRAGFAAQCIRVTAVGPNGERGPAFEDCAPQGCQDVDRDLAESDSLWEEIEDCEDEVAGEDGGIPDAGSGEDDESSGNASDSACRVADGGVTSAWPAALVLIALAVRRRRT